MFDVPSGLFPKLRAAADGALDFALPSRCAGCHIDWGPCCVRCERSAWGRPHRRYPRALPTTPAYALASHRDVARELVLEYKERGRRDLARPLGEVLARTLPAIPEGRWPADAGWWLVPAPSRRRAARARGGSHTLTLAEWCARGLALSGYPAAVAPALRLCGGARDMTEMGREQRARNLAGRVSTVRNGLPPAGSSVVLLDDVVTTGATAATCVRALGAAGCRVRIVLTLTAAC